MDLLVTQPTLCRSEPPSLYPTRSVRRASGFVLVGDSYKAPISGTVSYEKSVCRRECVLDMGGASPLHGLGLQIGLIW